MTGWYQITVVQRSCTCTRTEAGDWRGDQRAVFSHYNANRHRWPWPEQGIKSVGRHPMGEPRTKLRRSRLCGTVTGGNKLERNSESKVRRVEFLRRQMMKNFKCKRIKLNFFFWEIAVCAVSAVSNQRRAVGFTYWWWEHLSISNLVRHFIILSEGFTIDDAVRILYN